MAYRLFGAEPSPKPKLFYCQLDHCEQVSVKFESKYEKEVPRLRLYKMRVLKYYVENDAQLEIWK